MIAVDDDCVWSGAILVCASEYVSGVDYEEAGCNCG